MKFVLQNKLIYEKKGGKGKDIEYEEEAMKLRIDSAKYMLL